MARCGGRLQNLQMPINYCERNRKIATRGGGLQAQLATLNHANRTLQGEIEERSDGGSIACPVRRTHSGGKSIGGGRSPLRLIIDTAPMRSSALTSAAPSWSGIHKPKNVWLATREAIGRNLLEMIIPPQFKAVREGGLNDFLTDGKEQDAGRRVEVTARHKDGHELIVELAISLVRISNNFVSLCLLARRDGRARQTLKQSYY